MDVLLTAALVNRESRESYDSKTAATPDGKAVANALVQLVIGLVIGVIAVRLNWKCNHNVLYAILSWLFSVPYLVYRAISGRPC